MLKRSCIKSLSSKLPKFWFCGVFSPSLDMNLSRDFSIPSKYHLREEISSHHFYPPSPGTPPKTNKQTNKQTNKTSKVAKFQNISFNVYKFSRKWTRRSTPLQMWSQFGGCNATTLPRTSARYLADLLRGQELHRKRNLEYSK